MSLHDPKFKYRPSYDTDVGKTIRRAQREIARRLSPAGIATGATVSNKVTAIKRRKP